MHEFLVKQWLSPLWWDWNGTFKSPSGALVVGRKAVWGDRRKQTFSSSFLAPFAQGSVSKFQLCGGRSSHLSQPPASLLKIWLPSSPAKPCCCWGCSRSCWRWEELGPRLKLHTLFVTRPGAAVYPHRLFNWNFPFCRLACLHAGCWVRGSSEISYSGGH